MGDIEDDTHDVRIEGGAVFCQKHVQRNEYIKLVGMVGRALREAGRR